MSTTTTQTVNCPCCTGGSTVCSVCSVTGTGSDSGSLPTTLNVTLGNNTWIIQSFFCIYIGGSPNWPYLDCIGHTPASATIPGCDSTGNAPPPYINTASNALLVDNNGMLAPESFPVVWDSSYEVRNAVVGSPYSSGALLATGAWVYRSFHCHGWTEFRIIAYCLSNTLVVELIWLAPDNYSGTGTGTVTGEEVRGRLTTGISLGPSGYNGTTNSCSPVYFQKGNMTNFIDNSGIWSGSAPDQTPSGNVIDVTHTQSIPTIYVVVTA